MIDPASGRDEVADLLVEDGRLARIGASLDAPGAEIIEAEGQWVLPGLVDACVHLSVPGSGRAGDIASKPAPPPPVASPIWPPSRIAGRWIPPPWCG